MSDDELADEAGDFSTLLSKKKRGGGGIKRGSKNFQPNGSGEQQDAIDNSREALFELIGEEKPINSQFSFGILNDLDNDNSNNNNSINEKWLTTIVHKKGTHYQTMGHSIRGNLVLYLEEAAWLLNRYALYVHRKSNYNNNNDHHLDPSSTITTTIEKDSKEKVSFEDYCALMFTSKDGWITYEKYQVYAYLKRLGYNVQRSSCSFTSSTSTPSLITQTNQKISSSTSSHAIWYYRLIYPFINFWSGIKSVAYIMLKSIGLISKIKPLVCHNQFSNYGSLYSKLQIIQSKPWYEPVLNNTTNHSYTITWDVYKPNPKWKKRDPGVPDFRIVVGNMNDPLPSPDNFNYLFNLLHKLPYNESSYHPIRDTNSTHSQPAFLMALVSDAEGITFVRLQADGISSIIKDQL